MKWAKCIKIPLAQRGKLAYYLNREFSKRGFERFHSVCGRRRIKYGTAPDEIRDTKLRHGQYRIFLGKETQI